MPIEGSCEFQDELGYILKKTEVSMCVKLVIVCFLMDCMNFSAKNKYSILKYISSLSFE